VRKKAKAIPRFDISDQTARKVNAFVGKLMADPRFKSPFGADGKETEEYKKWEKEYDRLKKAWKQT